MGHEHAFLAAEDELLAIGTGDFGVDGLGEGEGDEGSVYRGLGLEMGEGIEEECWWTRHGV